MWILRTFVIIVLIVLVVGFSIYNSEEKLSCEREFFAPTNEEFQKIMKSWKFIE